MTNVFFNIVDSQSQPSVECRVILRPFNPPFLSASVLSNATPITLYTDVSGSVTFTSVIMGIYKVSISPPGALHPTNTLQNFANTVFYIGVPETNGMTVNGQSCILTNITSTSASFSGGANDSASFAYSKYASDHLFCLQVPGSSSWAPFAISASWASFAETTLNVLSASHAGFADNAEIAIIADFAENSNYANMAGTAVSASWAPVTPSDFAVSASWASQSLSASYSNTASFALNAASGNQVSCSYASRSLSASYSINADTASLAFNANTAIVAGSSNFSLNSNTANFATVAISATSASWASQSLSSSYAVSASYAPFTDNPNAVSASWASQSLSSSYAVSASYAPFTDNPNAVSASWASASLTAISSSYFSGSQIYTLNISASNEVIVPAPINPYDAATKNYVDSLFNPGNFDLYFRSASSDIANYHAMYRLDTPLSASSTDMVVNSVSASQYVFSFASPILGITSIQQGVISVHFHMYRNGGNSANTVQPEVYIRSGSTEYLELTAGLTVPLTTTTTDEFTVPITLTSSIALNPLTDRIVCKIKCINGTGTPNIHTVVEGQTAAGISISIPSSNYVLTSGGTMTGALTNPFGFVGTASYSSQSLSSSYAVNADTSSLLNGTIVRSSVKNLAGDNSYYIPEINNIFYVGETRFTTTAINAVSFGSSASLFNGTYNNTAAVRFSHGTSGSVIVDVTKDYGSNGILANGYIYVYFKTAFSPQNINVVTKGTLATLYNAPLISSVSNGIYNVYQFATSNAPVTQVQLQVTASSGADAFVAVIEYQPIQWPGLLQVVGKMTDEILYHNLTFKNPALTASLLFTNAGNISLSGSLFGNVTGSLFGTASQAISASYASFATSASYAMVTQVTQSVNIQSSASWASQSLSSSYALNAPNYIRKAGDLLNGQLELNSGASILCDNSSNGIVFAGGTANDFTLKIYNNDVLQLAGRTDTIYFSASNVIGTASVATSASFANNATSASYAPQLPQVSSSYASTASVAPNYIRKAGDLLNGQLELNSGASILCDNSSNGIVFAGGTANDFTLKIYNNDVLQLAGRTDTIYFSASNVIGTASMATTASYALNGGSASTPQVSCSYASSSLSSSYAQHAISADSTTVAGTAGIAINSFTASIVQNTKAYINTNGDSQLRSISGWDGLNSHWGFDVNGNATIADDHLLTTTEVSLFGGSIFGDVIGNLTATSFNGPLVGTASYAKSASFATNVASAVSATSASFANNATSASYAPQTSVTSVPSSSWASQSLSSSYALNAPNYVKKTGDLLNGVYELNSGASILCDNSSNGLVFAGGTTNDFAFKIYNNDVLQLVGRTGTIYFSASNVIGTASVATSASFAGTAINATSASHALVADTAASSTSASYAPQVPQVSCSYASQSLSASHAILADNATLAANATHAIYADGAGSATYATTAGTTNTASFLKLGSSDWIDYAGVIRVHAGTDQNFTVQPHIAFADGVAFSSINDANSANESMEFRATKFQLTAVGAGYPNTNVVIDGNANVTAPGFTGSLKGNATSASYSTIADTANAISFVPSFATSAGSAAAATNASFAAIAGSSSFASSSISASYAPINTGYSSSVSSQLGTKQNTLATSSTYPITASWATNVVNGGSGPAIRAGNVNAVFTNNITVTFSSPMADTNYAVSLTVQDTVYPCSASRYSNKTVNGFTIVLDAAYSGSIDWQTTAFI